MSSSVYRHMKENNSFEPGTRDTWRALLNRPMVPEFVLVLLTGIVYARSLTMGFVYDDHEMIDSPWLLGWKDIPKIFSQDLNNTHLSNFYRPLAALWQLLVHSLAGKNAALWHLSTILLHLLCVVLVFRLACRLLGDRGYATFAAAAFALHPTHVEAVTWIADSADLLLTCLLLLSASALLRWLDTGSRLSWTVSWLLAAACCFVKETGVLMPILLIVLALTVESNVSRPGIILTGFALLLPACSFLVLRSQILHGFAHPLSGATDYQMALTWPAALCFYLNHLVLPLKLGPSYPVAFVFSPRESAFVFPTFVLIALSAGLLWLARRADPRHRRLLFFSTVWIFIPLIAPLYLKLFPDFELVHDRYLYVPSIALGIALAYVLKQLSVSVPFQSRAVRKGLALITFIVPIALAAETISYEGVWQDDDHLFQRAIEITPRNARALVNLAVAKLQQGKYSEGTDLLRRSLEIQPNNAFALFDLGNVAWNNNDVVTTEFYVSKALALEPHANWWVILGSAKLKLGKTGEAEWAARQAIALDPTAPGGHFLLGAARLAERDPATAVQEIGIELQRDPANASARQALQAAEDQLKRQSN